MKRGLLLACALMVNASLASAEVVSAPLPDRHIQTAIERETYTIAVDADIYGETIDRVQAYRVTTLDWGENPEEAFDLALWFDETVPLEKRITTASRFSHRGKRSGSSGAMRRVSAPMRSPFSGRPTRAWSSRLSGSLSKVSSNRWTRSCWRDSLCSRRSRGSIRFSTRWA